MLSFIERHVVACLIAAIAAVFLLYETSVRFFAYTGDAFVDSNVVFIAPEVSGPLAKIGITDDATVAAGALIAEIDPEPFRIAEQSAQAAVTLAAKRTKMAQEAIAESTAMVEAAQATRDNAQREQTRAETLAKTGDISDADLDSARRSATVADAELRKAQSLLAVAQGLVEVRQAEDVATASALDKAQYDLAHTRILAPVSGRAAPLTVRTGDYATAGKALAAVVSNDNWHIMAAVDERHLSRLKVGQSVWFSIASDPWRPHRGTVRSISPGIARTASEQGPLPFVPLDTDWIRLPRRFPVLIDMGELPKAAPLYRGADARVLIWF
ncbi:membrane protein [Azorhizobium oxalatiphilum]|uniref:Membrane protein n=1 Tax=Azorhizobium oxalatiphilum TaxID=980631 RepID=A0A917FCN1_9HYPH|nr:HlyD family secretion protein [Azorhizobium oxalatiphilum]GGF70715.1 membrane protein [Azorhizobium oxalatiphilum]